MPGNNQACVPQLLSPWAATTEAHVPGVRFPQEKPAHHNKDPVQPKKKKKA